MEDSKIIGNLKVDSKEGTVIVSVNPKIYPLNIVYSAAYVFMDKAYLVLDGDPDSEIIVTLIPKDDNDLEKLGRDFNNELINYAVIDLQSKKNAGIREAIINKAVSTNDPDEEDYLDDPLGIAKPWEETHGGDVNEKPGC